MATTSETKPGTYRYRIKSTGGSSQKYGPCEVCAKPAIEVFLQVEEQAYLNLDDDARIGWTRHECHDLFGHESCLLGARRQPQAEAA